jgi:hypothetical protein|tara:strand:+ start:1416 stop:1562 length:147 start_codon:yes stop_codon:yes gene_type:complete
MINKLVEWHKKVIDYFMKKFNLSIYGIVWLAFIEGLMWGLLIMYLYLK